MGKPAEIGKPAFAGVMARFEPGHQLLTRRDLERSRFSGAAKDLPLDRPIA
jgi:hypothetical protein